MNNLKFFISAVGDKIVGFVKNPRREVVEMSTSEFLDGDRKLCFNIRG